MLEILDTNLAVGLSIINFVLFMIMVGYNS
jgi:hypothetical protein